ncbi:MAG: tetratricopeptide repeat protein [Bacteroidetes bacterium]|nr:tetratricopeptide repeat protein [Bacteroidota bacterium]
MKYVWMVLLLFSLMACNVQPKETESQKQDTTAVDPMTELSAKILADSLNADLLNTRAAMYVQRKQVDLAFRDLNKGLLLAPRNASLYITLADIYFGLGQIEQCSASLMKATEVAPDDPRAFLKLAELSLALGNHPLALSFNDKALAINKFNAEAYYERGLIFINKNDTISALKNFQLAIDQRDDYFDALLQTATIYTGQHNSLAESYLLKAILLFPENLRARYQLALYYQENNKVKEAITQYDTILIVAPNNKFALYNLGYINLVYLDNYETSLAYFDQVLQIDSEYVDAMYNKGRAMEAMGKYNEAKQIYKEVIRKRDNYPLAIEAINRIDQKR